MTVPANTTVSGPYLTNGSQTDFDGTFKAYAKNEIEVIFTDPDDNEFVADPVLYNVADLGEDDGFIVQFVDAPDNTIYPKVTIHLKPPIQQLTNLRNQGPYRPEVVERSLDRIVMICQYLAEEVSRALKNPISGGPGPGGGTADLTPLINSINKALNGIRADAQGYYPHVISPLVGLTAEELSGDLTLELPQVSGLVNGFNAIGPAISSTMPANYLRQYYLNEDNSWTMEQIASNLYTEIPRHPDKLKVWEIESGPTAVTRVSMVGPTYRQRTRPTDFYGNIDRLIELYYINDDLTAWSAGYTYTTYGQLFVTDAGRVYQVVVPGISGSVAPTATHGATIDDPVDDGTAKLFFVAMKDYVGMFRYGVNNGVEGYFSNLAVADMMHKKMVTGSPLSVPANTPVSDMALKHIKGHFRHLILERCDDGEYLFGQKMTQDGWIWRCTTPAGGTAASDDSAFGGSYSVGSTVTDGTIVWQAIYRHYYGNAFWMRVQNDFVTHFPADAHDSTASTLAQCIAQYDRIAGGTALSDFMGADSEQPSGSGTFYTYRELFDLMFDENLTNQVSDNLTKTFQNDINPYDGSVYNIQFLEDNCESWVGFDSAAYIYDRLGETTLRDAAAATAVLIDTMGTKGMLNVTINRYGYYRGNDPTAWAQYPGWYPYCQCQFFPEKCGLPHSISDIRYTIWASVFEMYPNWLQDRSRNFFPDNFLGVLLAGNRQDFEAAYTIVRNFELYYIQQNSATINEYSSYILTKDIMCPPFTLLDVASDGITVRKIGGAIERFLY